MTTIHCRCGIEVGLVRLNSETLVFGHKTNPRNNRHPVRLSRSVTASPMGSGDGSLSEASDTRRENANAGASPDPALPREPRSALRARAGSPALNDPGRVRALPPVRPASVIGLTDQRPGSLSAGRRSAAGA